MLAYDTRQQNCLCSVLASNRSAVNVPTDEQFTWRFSVRVRDVSTAYIVYREQNDIASVLLRNSPDALIDVITTRLTRASVVAYDSARVLTIVLIRACLSASRVSVLTIAD